MTRTRPGSGLIEIGIAALLLSLLVAVAGSLRWTLERGLSPSSRLERLQSMVLAVEDIKRTARVSERLVFPVPRLSGLSKDDVSRSLYLVRNGCPFLYLLDQDRLIEMRLEPDGSRRERTLCPEVGRIAFATLGGRHPGLRVLVQSGDLLIVDQVLLLDAHPPAHLGGAGHGF